MPAKMFQLSGLVLIVAIGATSALADHWAYVPLRPQPPGALAGPDFGIPTGYSAARASIQQVSGEQGGTGMVAQGYPPVMMMPAPSRYPQMHAPMYPSPVPNVPVQVGGTTISNQAFAPHEMTYRHEYKALFPPFYYKVSGSWLKTPWGMESHDKWVLQGTEVNVKYRDRYSLFSGFHPPVLR